MVAVAKRRAVAFILLVAVISVLADQLIHGGSSAMQAVWLTCGVRLWQQSSRAR
jgi:hypothetical protein